MNARLTLPADFLLQAEDLIARLDADLALLRRSAQEPRHVAYSERRKIVERLFRSAHTLKGAAATFDEPVTARLAFEIENILHLLRLASRVPLTAALGEALHAAVDTISAHLRGRAGASDTDDEERYRVEIETAARGVIAQLQTCASELQKVSELQEAKAMQEAGETTADSLELRPEELPVEWQDAPLERAIAAHLRDAVRDELNLFSLVFSFNLETFEEDYRGCEAVLREQGEIILSRPLPLAFDAPIEDGTAQVAPRIKFCLLYAADLEAADLNRMLTGYEATSLPLRLFTGDTEDVSPSRVGNGAFADESPEEATELVRVSLGELDELVHLVAELNDETRAQLAAHVGEMGSESAMGDDLRGRFLDVQERLLRLRMTPIESRLQEAARAGRVAARARGKQVEWKITGGDVRLDKALAEQLTAPLLHLVRNAVDHGIEITEERSAAGKPERGTINLQAEARGGQVRVLVTDDGRGIEPERVRAAAIARRIISPARRLKGDDHLRLIFRPGFTTTESNDGVAAVSGRGVGLDVAERAVRELGGELRVNSTSGRGTTFEMRLPLTLALLRAVVVRDGKHRYCLPAEQVLDHIRFDPNQVTTTTADSSHLLWRDTRVPLIRLSSLLAADAKSSMASATTEEPSFALILRTDGGGFNTDQAAADEGDPANCVALAVDEWELPDELLARGLGAHAPQWLGVLGAVARPDGTIALLLDITELMEARGKG